MDLNQFVGSDKHLEETLLENRWRFMSVDLSKWQCMEISVSSKNIHQKASCPNVIFNRWEKWQALYTFSGFMNNVTNRSDRDGGLVTGSTDIGYP